MDSFFNTRIAYQALEAIINVYYFKYAKHNIQIGVTLTNSRKAPSVPKALDKPSF